MIFVCLFPKQDLRPCVKVVIQIKMVNYYIEPFEESNEKQ